MSGVDGQNNDQTGLVELMEFCGEIYTKDGELIVRNGRFVIANRKHLLLKPQEYDYLHGETPYVIMNPENIVQYGYPQSFIWNYLDLIESNSDLYNLTVDTARMALPLITYYSGGLALDPEEFLDGIYPGMTIPLNNPGSDHVNIQTAPVNPGAVLAILQYSQQQLQQINSGLVQAGLPSGRGRQSATEVNAAQALANSFIVDIMDSISKTFLSPLIERSLFLIAQYQDDFADEKWKWILGDTHEPFIEAISSMDITDTLGLLRIRVEEPADILRKRMTAETLISSFKTMMQAVPGYLNVPVHLYDIYKLLGLDPQRYINTEINYRNLAMAGFLNGLLPQLQQGGQPLPQGNEGLTAYNQPGATFPGGMPQGMPMQGGMPQGMPPQGMPPQRGGY